MLDTVYNKNEMGLIEATCTMTLPPVTLTRIKASKSDLKWAFRDGFTDLIGEIIEKHLDD